MDDYQNTCRARFLIAAMSCLASALGNSMNALARESSRICAVIADLTQPSSLQRAAISENNSRSWANFVPSDPVMAE